MAAGGGGAEVAQRLSVASEMSMCTPHAVFLGRHLHTSHSVGVAAVGDDLLGNERPLADQPLGKACLAPEPRELIGRHLEVQVPPPGHFLMPEAEVWVLP